MKFLLVIFLALSMTVSVFATEIEGEDVEVIDDEPVTIDGLMSDLDLTVNLPIDDQSSDLVLNDENSVDTVAHDEVSTLALVGSNGVYNQAWSGSVLDYFSGIVSKDPFCDYVIYRMDNSAYYCWYGDIDLSNGYFSGSDLNVVYYEASSYNSPLIRFTSGATLSLSAEGFIYSNLGSFSDITNNQGVRLAYVEIVSICILIGMYIVSSILRTG